MKIDNLILENFTHIIPLDTQANLYYHSIVNGGIMIKDIDIREKPTKDEAMALAKLYLEQSRNGVGESVSLIKEVIRLLNRECFTFSEIGTDVQELQLLLKTGRERETKALEGKIVYLNKGFMECMESLRGIS